MSLCGFLFSIYLFYIELKERNISHLKKGSEHLCFELLKYTSEGVYISSVTNCVRKATCVLECTSTALLCVSGNRYMARPDIWQGPDWR